MDSPVKRTTIREVAEQAGVSVASVSRAFSGAAVMRPATRERILQVARELGYRPNGIARNLRTQRSKIIGLIISDVENPFYTSLVRAVEDSAHAQQFSLVLCNSDESPEKERNYIQFLADERVAGVIGSPTSETTTSFLPLQRAGIPVVAVDRRSLLTPVDTVLLDNVRAAYDLTRYLIAQGHQRIGIILPGDNITSGRERLTGFLQAMHESGLPVRDEWICSGKGSEAFGFQSAIGLLSQIERPTALLSGNNLITLGVLKAVQHLGLRVPQQVGLAGLDEMPWMTLLRMPLLIAAQPVREMGQRAFELLCARMSDSAHPIREVRLAHRLVYVNAEDMASTTSFTRPHVDPEQKEVMPIQEHRTTLTL